MAMVTGQSSLAIKLGFVSQGEILNTMCNVCEGLPKLLAPFQELLNCIFRLYIYQSATSRLETSRYRDFSQFFESIGLGLEKKSRYRSRKYLVSKKSLGIGLENI